MRFSMGRLAGFAVLIMVAGCSRGGSDVIGSGTVEMDEIDISSMVGGRVVRLAYDEGDSVNAGDTLAVLDRGELAADIDAQTAQAARAGAELRDLQSGPRSAEVAVARAELAAATAQAALSAAELKRVQTLADQNLTTAQELDRARSASAAAAARRDAVAQQVRLLQSGYRSGRIAAAAQAATAARAQLAGARTRAGELLLTAPSRGLVLLRNFEPGEIALPGAAVVTLGNPDSLWMRCYVAAPKLARVKLGAPVSITIDGTRRVFRGRVVEISPRAEFTPRAALTEEERANLVFAVKIVIEPSGGVLKAGLPADVRLLDGAR